MTKIKFLSLLTIALSVALVSCGQSGSTVVSSNSATSSASQTSSIVPNSLSSSDIEEQQAIIASAKLTEAYDGTNFRNDGVGAQKTGTDITFVDGDTTHFKEIADNFPIKIRYYGIDTPESTGQIQKWGKAASNFTHNALAKATAIVVTRPDMAKGPAEIDSTGSRYVGYVWYATKADPTLDDFTLLNLEIVANGYSAMKAVGTDNPYYDAFVKADAFAQLHQLNTYAPDSVNDPLFYTGEAANIDLAELYANPIRYVDYSKDNYPPEGALTTTPTVTLTGVVSAVQGTNAWIQADISPDDVSDPVTYGLYVFTGFKPMKPLQTVGNEVRITGKVSSWYGNFQMSGVSYSEYLPGANDVKLLSTGNALSKVTIQSADDLNKINDNILLDAAGIEVTGGYGGAEEIDPKTGSNYTDNAITLYGKLNGTDVTVRLDDSVQIRDKYEESNYKPIIRSYKKFLGKTLTVTGGIGEAFNKRKQIVIPNEKSLDF